MKDTWFIVYSKLINGNILNKLGSALGLLLYLYDKTTYQKDGIGVVLGGTQITNNEIANDLNIGSRSITRYVKLLTELGFIYTINVNGNYRIWFVIGYQKWNKNSPSKKKLDSLVRRVRALIFNDVNNGAIKPINPFFSEVDNSVNICGTRKTDKSTTKDKSDPSPDKSDVGQDKNGMSNKDNTVDKTIDKTVTTKDIEKFSINPNPIALKAGTAAASDDAKEVYKYYMQTIGSRKNNPSDEEIRLITNILEIEEVDTIKNCIDKYVEAVNNNESWRFFPPLKFFKDDFYFGFLDPNRWTRYKPRRAPRDPAKEYDDNN